MLFYRPGMKNPIRLQSPFVDNTEIEAIVKAYNSFVN
jgi:DNA segregation ATPase FtsK/SpoIIIE-like protein